VRATAGQELRERKRLHQVVVRAEVERVDAIGNGIARRHDQYGKRLVRAADAPDEARAILERQPEVDDREVERLAEERGARELRRGDVIDHIAVQRQSTAHRAGDDGIVLDDQDSHRVFSIIPAQGTGKSRTRKIPARDRPGSR
jgi:hypothetical protein